MFYFDDDTHALEAKLEVFGAMELELADKRKRYLMWSLFMPVAGIIAWLFQGADAGSTQQLLSIILMFIIEIALVTLFINAWIEITNIRSIIRKADKEISRRAERAARAQQ